MWTKAADVFAPRSGHPHLSASGFPTQSSIHEVLAAMVCGLQLSFWEHATAVTGAMIDLLLFAYIIRCLLEYRIDQNESWLSRCALVYGAGMVNDWAMIGYLPIFIAALVRITGFGVIYNRRLLRRTILWGLAGLCLYLWLPVLHHFSSQGAVGFWVARFFVLFAIYLLTSTYCQVELY
jgi:hypothetical protein